MSETNKKLVGFEYYVNGDYAIFPDQKYPNTIIKMNGFTMQPNDTVKFYHGTIWRWNGKKFTMASATK